MNPNHEANLAHMKNEWLARRERITSRKNRKKRARPQKPPVDTCPYHDCPLCDKRMTSRQCLKCKRANGTPMTVRFCALCDGGPIVIAKEDK